MQRHMLDLLRSVQENSDTNSTIHWPHASSACPMAPEASGKATGSLSSAVAGALASPAVAVDAEASPGALAVPLGHSLRESREERRSAGTRRLLQAQTQAPECSGAASATPSAGSRTPRSRGGIGASGAAAQVALLPKAPSTAVAGLGVDAVAGVDGEVELVVHRHHHHHYHHHYLDPGSGSQRRQLGNLHESSARAVPDARAPAAADAAGSGEEGRSATSSATGGRSAASGGGRSRNDKIGSRADLGRAPAIWQHFHYHHHSGEDVVPAAMLPQLQEARAKQRAA
eukprot:TRINITY_DN16006_c0_g1_i1.p1 TRINITY_DN16006_c0_g1~~TRINITY_DN16006_c0_g1_i1.p1  ORF type:complete len:286 (-),score=55.40 TRINITY_DN16006_c0_g1_i1:65-922(-)